MDVPYGDASWTRCLLSMLSLPAMWMGIRYYDGHVLDIASSGGGGHGTRFFISRASFCEAMAASNDFGYPGVVLMCFGVDGVLLEQHFALLGSD